MAKTSTVIATFLFIFKFLRGEDIFACGLFGIDNGEIKIDPEKMEISYTCYKGYQLIGSSTIRCNDITKKFEPTKPTCTLKVSSNDSLFWEWNKIFVQSHQWEGDYSVEKAPSGEASNRDPFSDIEERVYEPVEFSVLTEGKMIEEFTFLIKAREHQPILLSASEVKDDKLKLIFLPQNLSESHPIFPKDDWKLEIMKYRSEDDLEFRGTINIINHGRCPIKLYQPRVGEQNVTDKPPPVTTGGIIAISLGCIVFAALLIGVTLFMRGRMGRHMEENDIDGNSKLGENQLHKYT